MPFSSGRRVCVGESLAKAQLHLSAAFLLQRFTFKPPPGETLKLENTDTGLFICAKPYKVTAIPRM